MNGLMVIVLAVVIMLVLAAVLSWILGWANVAFAVPVDPKEEKILAVLPGANCGACGFAGCADFAKSLAAGNGSVTQCTQSGQAQVIQIAEILGIAAGEVIPYRAVVHCSAHLSQRKRVLQNLGEQTCAATNLIPAVQGCTFGCMGQGDCTRACKYGAITIVDGLATVNYDKCVGCKACVAACPRGVITVEAFKQSPILVVGCNNRDKLQDVKAVCDVGCVGCGVCAKRAPEAFAMNDGLPVLNFAVFNNVDAETQTVIVDKCPAKVLVYRGTSVNQ